MGTISKKEVKNQDADKQSFGKDTLGRKNIAKNIIDILLKKSNRKVFSINAPWGQGKTYFIENLIALMKEQNSNAFTVKYNAWETDFYNDPLIPVCAELIKNLKEEAKLKDNKLDELQEDLKNMSISQSIGFNLGVVNASMTFTQNEGIVDNYLKTVGLIEKFKTDLKSIQDKIEKPIIIFIDELDRCRPDYAIKTLEVIKHFFDIEDIKFVIAVDREQILNSVKSMYGESVEGGGYLRKFIDLDLFLPEPDLEAYAKFIYDGHCSNAPFDKRYLEYPERATYLKAGMIANNYIFEDLNNIKSLRGKEITKKDILIEIIASIAKKLNFSLRDLEKLFIRLEVTISNLKENEIFLPQLLVLLNVMKLKSNDDYRAFQKGLYYLSKKSTIDINVHKNNHNYDYDYKTGCDYFSKLISIMRTIQDSEERNGAFNWGSFLESHSLKDSHYIFNQMNSNQIRELFLSYFDKVDFADKLLEGEK